MQAALARMLPDGNRLHLQHGPVDLIVEASGDGRGPALSRAAARFGSVLEELVHELSVLRKHHARIAPVNGPVALRMARAVAPFSDRFVTPMAAVAGAVADEILATLTATPGIARAYVNNGGDIAFRLTPGESFTAAIAGTPPARAILCPEMPSRGIATSGWRGRSHSLGIADSVTVLAADAATADAAATMIANAVDLPGHPGIARTPAAELCPDSDLGSRPVTTHVRRLATKERAEALQNGLAPARAWLDHGLIHAAFLTLQGQSRSLAHAAILPAIKDLAHA
ncbi:MAG: UPF0280 family protein [Rhodobacteraceae bacterium]|nr:UPF0280 family protein [Paracoccaceae bacterium]